MRTTTAILWVSISLLLLPDDLLAATTDGELLSIWHHVWVTVTLLQFANLWLGRIFGIVMFDYDWLFWPFTNLIYGKWSTLPINEIQSAVSAVFNRSVVSSPASTSLISSVPILPPLVTLQSLEEMLASRIIVQKPPPATATSRLDATSEQEISAEPSPPYQRRSLWPTLHYHFGSTVGSPRHMWQSSKENCTRETSGEVNGPRHLSEGNVNTPLTRSSSNVVSAHPQVTDMPLNKSFIPMSTSMAAQQRKQDDDGGLFQGLEESTTKSENEDGSLTSDEGICASYDTISQGTETTSDLVDEAIPNATVDDSERSWFDIPPFLDGTLLTATSSIQDFMIGIDDAQGALN